MKKTIFGLWAVLMASMFWSCNEVKTPDDEVEHLAWDSIVADTTVLLCDEADSPSAEIHLNIKYADGKHAQAVNDSLLRSGILMPDYLSLQEKEKKMTVEEAVKLFIDSYMADYKKDFGELYNRDQEHSASYNLQYSCQTDVADRGNIISYVAQVYSFAGGAHGMNFTIAKNIEAKTGKILKLGDVFVPGYEEKTKELIVEKMQKKFDVKDLEGLREKSIFVGIEPYVPTNFILGDDDVEFIYCDTEIAPHAVGEIRIAVPRKQLDDLLKKTE